VELAAEPSAESGEIGHVNGLGRSPLTRSNLLTSAFSRSARALRHYLDFPQQLAGVDGLPPLMTRQAANGRSAGGLRPSSSV
jgi:hypothetical protein